MLLHAPRCIAPTSLPASVIRAPAGLAGRGARHRGEPSLCPLLHHPGVVCLEHTDVSFALARLSLTPSSQFSAHVGQLAHPWCAEDDYSVFWEDYAYMNNRAEWFYKDFGKPNSTGGRKIPLLRRCTS